MPELHDGELPAEGVTLRPAPWRLPETITPEMVADARSEAIRHQAMMQPVAQDSLRRWLVALGNLTARQAGDPDDVSIRLDALGMMFEDEPAAAFTKASLKRAAARFKFFPAAAELTDFVAHEIAAQQRRGERLMKILDAGSRQTDGRWNRQHAAEADRRLYDEKNRERAEMAAALGVPVIPVPPRAAGESDRDYGIRLAQHAKALCREAGKVLNVKPAKPKEATP